MQRLAILIFAPLILGLTSSAQDISAPTPQPGVLTGTVEDATGGIIPEATVTLDPSNPSMMRSMKSDGNGFFILNDVASGIEHRITVHVTGFMDWTSPAISLTPGQQVDLTDIRMIPSVETTVTAIMPEQLALQQVQAEEKQRVLGVIPNFYVVYDKNAVPLTKKLKFQLAFRASIDPVTIGGVAFLSGIYQAADTPNYQQGLKGYGQRFGATGADGFSDIMIGGAILPSLLHQDPRYFYQGTGSTQSRFWHAVSAPFICKGDNGKLQFNYSSVGGDLASGALSNLYYPTSNRGASLVFTGALVTTGGRIANALAQEFLLHRFTSKASDTQ